ncbi:hypothetical protein ACMFMG_005618 [Clarireedia jacksonii]
MAHRSPKKNSVRVYLSYESKPPAASNRESSVSNSEHHPKIQCMTPSHTPSDPNTTTSLKVQNLQEQKHPNHSDSPQTIPHKDKVESTLPTHHHTINAREKD